MAKVLMIQGTMSNVGKSVLTAGLCRVFKRKDYRVAPFKSQNMSLNSYVTKDGGEMGRAQVMQAEAAGIEPDARMNPILLKPTGDMTSQVIVNGKARVMMPAREYFSYRKTLVPEVLSSFRYLAERSDLILIEGAGSPAEINLMQDDIVNMGLARLVGAPVLLVGDIDRGGVFAQLFGTVKLLPQADQDRIRGLVINRFRGDVGLLRPGLTDLETLTGKKVLGVMPFLNLSLDDEDSLSDRLKDRKRTKGTVDLAVVRLPHLSNFTDLDTFDQAKGVSVRYVTKKDELEGEGGVPDLLILPGSRNTIKDLLWLKDTGLADKVKDLAALGTPVIGICGGFQMLGEEISDPDHVEGDTAEAKGLGLLPCKTVLEKEKTTVQTKGEMPELFGVFAPLSGKDFEGYEIHQGVTEDLDGRSVCFLQSGKDGNVLGTYVHGIFDTREMGEGLLSCLAGSVGDRALRGEIERTGSGKEESSMEDYASFRDHQYDLLADALEESLDIPAIEEILQEAKIQ